MIFRIFAVAVALILGVSFAGIKATEAMAAGSDGPIPYTVTTDGVFLTDGKVFPAHGHVNWRTNLGSYGMHFDPNNNQPGGAFIGQTFFEFTPSLKSGECVVWVQVSLYNEHFGEGGQSPICFGTTPTPEPTVDPTPTPEPTVDPTPEPTPTVEPTPEPTVTPTVEPTQEPTSEPTPTVEPTTVPTSEPSENPEEPKSESKDELANTGYDYTLLAVLSVGLLICGILFLLMRRSVSRR